MAHCRHTLTVCHLRLRFTICHHTLASKKCNQRLGLSSTILRHRPAPVTLVHRGRHSSTIRVLRPLASLMARPHHHQRRPLLTLPRVNAKIDREARPRNDSESGRMTRTLARLRSPWQKTVGHGWMRSRCIGLRHLPKWPLRHIEVLLSCAALMSRGPCLHTIHQKPRTILPLCLQCNRSLKDRHVLLRPLKKSIGPLLHLRHHLCLRLPSLWSLRHERWMWTRTTMIAATKRSDRSRNRRAEETVRSLPMASPRLQSRMVSKKLRTVTPRKQGNSKRNTNARVDEITNMVQKE